MDLKSKTSYFVGHDFIIHTEGRMGSQDMQAYIDNKPELDWLEDLRLPCVSVVTHDNVIEHIRQYTLHYGILMHKNPVVSNYLDFGFIPVAFYPTCYSAENERIDQIIERFGVDIFKFPAIYAGDVRYRNAHTDTWVSRMAVSELFRVAPEELNTMDIWERWLRYEVT
jgi:hypothetical protein